jgi:hypothetical protein
MAHSKADRKDRCAGDTAGGGNKNSGAGPSTSHGHRGRSLHCLERSPGELPHPFGTRGEAWSRSTLQEIISRHPGSESVAVRAYVREGGARGWFAPVSWWCRECGERLTPVRMI